MPVDATGEFYDGTPLDGPVGSAEGVAEASGDRAPDVHREPDGVRARPRVEYFDMPTVRTIVRDAAVPQNKFSAFMLGVVKSPAFQMSRAEASPRLTTDDTGAIGVRHVLDETAHFAADVLRGMGATIALPFLDAMVPARTLLAKTAAAERTRLSCIEMVHGAAGSTAFGVTKNLWSPAAVGREFDLTPSSMSPLEPFRDYLTIVSNTDVRTAEAFEPKEIGGDHFRSSAVFLTQAHPKQTEGSDVYVGTSLDQLYAQRFGQDTPIPSMQLCIENVDQAGGCAYGYACVYTDTISWASPTEPLPMIRDPRVAFDMLFGVGGTPEERAAQPAHRTQHPRLDHGRSGHDFDATSAPTDRARLDEYLEDIREIERRIQKIEARNASGEPRELPGAPVGVPDSFEEHVKLMFDLQALAFAGDITRVFSFKLGRDGSARVYPESGIKAPFHPASHHGETRRPHHGVRADQQVPRRLRAVLPGEAEEHARGRQATCSTTRWSSTARRWAIRTCTTTSGARCSSPGTPAAQLKGNLHLKAPDGTPMANVMLTLLHELGLDDLEELRRQHGRVRADHGAHDCLRRHVERKNLETHRPERDRSQRAQRRC